MEKEYTKEPTRTTGEISNLLKTSEDVSVTKAQEVSKVSLTDFTRDGFQVSIISQPHYVEGTVEFSVLVKKDGKKIPISNPIKIKNPPIMVEDGTFYKKIDEYGEVIESPNLKEDPAEALRQIIIQLCQR